MDYLYKIEDRILDELKDISAMDAQAEMSMDDLTHIKYLSSSLDHISSYLERRNGGMSHDSGMGGYSNGGYSYARGRNRDSMGRFSSRGGYSRGRMMDDEWGREYGMY